jgi:chromosomal replication initiation ATPase DnaA
VSCSQPSGSHSATSRETSIIEIELIFNGIGLHARERTAWVMKTSGQKSRRETHRAGIRLADDERILGSSRFVEKTLEQTEEAYERRMQASGLDLSRVIDAVSGFFKVKTRDLAGSTRRLQIALA